MSTSTERIEELWQAREKLKHMRTISEHEQLRSMNLEQRLDWMRERIRQRIGMIFVRIDGHLIAGYADQFDDLDRKSTRLNSSHVKRSRMPSSA